MVGDGNKPITDSTSSDHYDAFTLEEYVLGQLLPDQETEIRQHLEHCPLCRAQVADIQRLCGTIKYDLHQSLVSSCPSPELDFDKIASDWRKPPRRVTWSYRIKQALPGVSTVTMLVLFVIAFLVLSSTGESAEIRGLSLTTRYPGPPAMVAAATDSGLVVIELSDQGATIVGHLDHINDPHDLHFSPDGTWLAFRQGNSLRIVESANPEQLFRIDIAETAEWAWSPDSKMLALTDGTGQLLVYDMGIGEARIVVPSAEHAWGTPLWNDDATELFYSVVSPQPGSSAGGITQQGIWRVALDSGFRVELARNPNPDQNTLIPTAWIAGSETLVAWDINAGMDGKSPGLFLIDAASHDLVALDGGTIVQGHRLAWPVSTQGQVFAVSQEHLTLIDLLNESTLPIPDQIPWPANMDWAPNGAWITYTVSNAPSGKGLKLFAPQDGTFRSLEMPEGAFEKVASWAGSEHLFVIRQKVNPPTGELWLVSLTSTTPPIRIMTNVRMPEISESSGYLWQDVLEMQVITRPD